MKRKNLELIVLILGIAIIGVALFFMLGNKTPKSIFITNIVFSVGFLVYILYSMMTTSSLNQEIRRLHQHVQSLKEEIAAREKTINEKDARISTLNQDKEGLQNQLTDLQKESQSLKNRITELESTRTTDSQE